MTRSPEIEKLRQWAIAYRQERIQKYHLELSETHAVSHWDRVYENGLKLLDEGVRPKVLEAFAYTHDVCRNSDRRDLDHGPRAAEEALPAIRHTLLAFLDDEEFDLLVEACREHTACRGSIHPTVNACCDADRLDLTRIHVAPDPDKMCSPKGRVLAAESRAAHPEMGKIAW